MTDLTDSLAAPAPPPDLAPALQALWWLAKGGFRTGPSWERAHALCQDREGEPACDRVHALAHLIEGDRGNAAYWYRRAGSAPAGDSPEEDWARQVSDLVP